ncbi:hypothetical protein INR18_28615, partial [Klebsiella pneumoniae]|nr:hypothetical protein [Klebsiella pneumoniae]
SVGQDVDYYQKISNLPESVKVSLLEALKDIAYAPELIDLVKDWIDKSVESKTENDDIAKEINRFQRKRGRPLKPKPRE